MLEGKIIEINETDPHLFTYFLVAETFKYIIGKFDYKIMSIIIFPDVLSTKFRFKNCQKKMLFQF